MERITQKELPEGFINALRANQEYIDKSGLDEKLLELIRMRVSFINSCAYCLDMHFKEGIAAGETPLRLFSVAVWRETTYYSPAEQAALEFAEALTYMPANVSTHHLHDELLKYYTKQQIALLTLAIIQINSWNRLTRSFGTVAGNYQVRRKAAETA